MDLRHYLHILRRQRWLIILTVVVVAVAAGLFASFQTKKYSATTEILLRPDDPTETLGTPVQDTTDLPRYVSAQAAIVKSLPVAQSVARDLKTSESGAQLLHEISVSTTDTSNVMDITATAGNATRARDLANAFGSAYIANRKDFDVNRLQQAVTAIQGRLSTLQAEIDRLSAGSATASDTDRTNLQLLTTQYSNLIAQLQPLQVEISLKHGEAETIAQAVTPAGPSSPRPKRDIFLGLIAGLLLGVALAFAREQMDTRIRSIEDAEQSTELMLLGQIPFDLASRRNDRHLAVRDDTLGQASEAMRALRTAVDLHPNRPNVPRIVVTSPGRGDGKTLVAANLAAAFAEAGQRTLLVSADLRHPRLERLFGLPRSPGIGDYVYSTGISEHAVVASTDVRDLFVLKAGSVVSNPAGIFMSDPFDELLATASEGMDVILFDSPPVLAVTDATVIAARADEVLLVVAEDGTSRGEAQRARSVLENAGGAVVLGVVVNKVPVSASSFDSYRPVVR